MGVGGAGHRDVGTPHQKIIGVVPIGGFGHVGLFAPSLRRSGRQVAIPVVKRQRHAADQAEIARAGGIADHRHGGNRREADNAVGAVFLDGVAVGRRHHFIGFVPVGTHEAAQTALGFVGFGALGVFHNPLPCFDGVFGFARFAPQFGQRAAHHRIFDALGGIDVPTVRRAARAAARLVVGQVGAGTRIIGLLGFPGDDAVFNVDFPRARTGTVHAVGGAGDFVVRPAAAVGVLPLAVFFGQYAVAVGERFVLVPEKCQAV